MPAALSQQGGPEGLPNSSDFFLGNSGEDPYVVVDRGVRKVDWL